MGTDTPPRVDSMDPETRITELRPLEFHYVKALFLQQQYRQCITTSRAILDADREDDTRHPLEQTWMRLYIALAHHELAAAMHVQSSSKASAYDQAEILYQEASSAIPSAQQCAGLLREYDLSVRTLEKECASKSNASLPASTSQSTMNSDILRRAPSPSPFLSPPTRAYTSPPHITSPARSSSETEEDLESHDSFGQLTSPHGIPRLPSTFSSMSLLDPQQAHGLLRPVRPGSIAKPYQLPMLPSPTSNQYRSKLPRLNTTPSLAPPRQKTTRQSSPVRKQLRSPDEDWSPSGSLSGSPVSPLSRAYNGSDDGTISPISPTTPADTMLELETVDKLTRRETGVTALDRLDEHLQGMRAQIDTQLQILREARERTIAMQEERAALNSRRKVAASESGRVAGMQQSRSFWLFTPSNVKAMDKQKRIEDGRARKWARPRFDPSRYRNLAEKAVAELCDRYPGRQ